MGERLGDRRWRAPVERCLEDTRCWDLAMCWYGPDGRPRQVGVAEVCPMPFSSTFLSVSGPRCRPGIAGPPGCNELQTSRSHQWRHALINNISSYYEYTLSNVQINIFRRDQPPSGYEQLPSPGSGRTPFFFAMLIQSMVGIIHSREFTGLHPAFVF